MTDLGSKTLLAFHGWYDYSYSDENLEKILNRKKQLWFDRRLKRLDTDRKSVKGVSRS